MKKRNLAIVIYEDAEVLDFAGPFEVFAVTDERNGGAYFDVSLVAEQGTAVRAVNGMLVVPNYAIANAPPPDIVVIAGGAGSRKAIENVTLLSWLKSAVDQAEIVMSVCSGARLLAVLGLLDDQEVTTHHEVLGHLAELAPNAMLRPNARFTDNGKIVTTGGITAGIDASFHLVARLHGLDVARDTANYMEYDWTPEHTYGRTTVSQHD